MNYSPLNDPEFQQYRDAVRKKAAKKRRARTLIILVSVTLVAVLAVVLLGLAAMEALPKISGRLPFGHGTQPTLPPIIESPTEDPSGVTPVTPTEPTPTPSEPATPTPVPVTPTPTTPTEPTGVIRKTTVYIDPGHGFLSPSGKAMDYGTGENSAYFRLSSEQGRGLYESDLNLIISLKLRDRLIAAGYDVIMSREDYVKTAMPLETRAAYVRASKADVCVSVHANSYDGAGTAMGARVYCATSAKRTDAAACQALATSVINAINDTGATRRNITAANNGDSLVMCNSTKPVPSILVETCFLTDEQDAANALTEEWQDKMAAALFQGITAVYPLQYYFE